MAYKLVLLSLLCALVLVAQSPSVTLTWQDTVDLPDPLTSYKVYRSPGPTCSVDPIFARAWDPTFALLASWVYGNTYTDTTVVSGQSYCYFVSTSIGILTGLGVGLIMESIPSGPVAVSVP